MPIQQISPQEAKTLLDADPEMIYVDVRSVAEFSAGHPERAINIPLLDHNEELGGMVPNPDFKRVAEAHLPKDKKIIVGCQVGGRSQKACEILTSLGFLDLCNVQGGFGGTPSTPGWKTLGLPVSQENGEGISFSSLKKKL